MAGRPWCHAAMPEIALEAPIGYAGVTLGVVTG